MYCFSLSVKQLIDFVIRKIENADFQSNIQDEFYKANSRNTSGTRNTTNVQLRHCFNLDDYKVDLYGKCNRIYDDTVPTIEVIDYANSEQDNKKYNDDNDPLLAEAACYAYMYADLHNIDIIGVRVSRYDIKNKNNVVKKYIYTKNTLLQQINKYLKIFFEFRIILDKRLEKRNLSLKNIKFPFENIRKGQEDVVDRVNNSYKNHDFSFIQASTGIGKTIATIFGTLNGFRTNRIKKVFYTTPKNTGFTNAFKALKKLNDVGYYVNAVELVSKEKNCPYKGDIPCDARRCKLLSNFNEKVNNALKEIIVKQLLIKKEVIQSYADKYEICPFELSLAVSQYVDFIVCDYNYVFDPIANLKRYFENPTFGDIKKVLLVDEAHNLIGRARLMFSASFSSKTFNEFKTKFRDETKNNTLNVTFESAMKKHIKRLTTIVNNFKKFEYGESDYLILQDLDSNFIRSLNNLNDEIKKYEIEFSNNKFKFFDSFGKDSFKFLDTFKHMNDGYRIVIKKEENNNFNINLFCINPSHYLLNRCHCFEGVTFFSATLNPIDYYKNVLLGYSLKAEELILPSPYDENNLKVIINNNISIKYKDRKKTIDDVISQIMTFVDYRIGNYMIFAPSYEYLELLRSRLHSDDRFFFQKVKMAIEEQQKFLDKFEEDPLSTKIGVCVLGGSFNEGIDLVGDRLIGAVVIGVGIPKVCTENELISKYYTEAGLNGYDYSYTNPGINKILQAVGRVIRTETDKGAVLLIDSRYKYKQYKEICNKTWQNIEYAFTADEIKNVLERFYSNF